MDDSRLIELLNARDELADRFFIILAVCHTVVPEHNPDDVGPINYQASSPGMLIVP